MAGSISSSIRVSCSSNRWSSCSWFSRYSARILCRSRRQRREFAGDFLHRLLLDPTMMALQVLPVVRERGQLLGTRRPELLGVALDQIKTPQGGTVSVEVAFIEVELVEGPVDGCLHGVTADDGLDQLEMAVACTHHVPGV